MGIVCALEILLKTWRRVWVKDHLKSVTCCVSGVCWLSDGLSTNSFYFCKPSVSLTVQSKWWVISLLWWLPEFPRVGDNYDNSLPIITALSPHFQRWLIISPRQNRNHINKAYHGSFLFLSFFFPQTAPCLDDKTPATFGYLFKVTENWSPN